MHASGTFSFLAIQPGLYFPCLLVKRKKRERVEGMEVSIPPWVRSRAGQHFIPSPFPLLSFFLPMVVGAAPASQISPFSSLVLLPFISQSWGFHSYQSAEIDRQTDRHFICIQNLRFFLSFFLSFSLLHCLPPFCLLLLLPLPQRLLVGVSVPGCRSVETRSWQKNVAESLLG